MIKVKIFTVGKTKESWLHEALKEYEKRLKSYYSVSWVFFRNEEALILAMSKEKNYLSLDPSGHLFTSKKLAEFLEKEVATKGAELSFVIGGATGIPESVNKRATRLISLSSLTFTHQMARLILLEQLYRCFQIQKGTPYHK